MLLQPLNLQMSDDYWQHKALCRGLWHMFDAVEDENGNDSYPFLEEAKALCDECPVFTQCRRDGVKERSAIWAGKIVG